VQGVTPDPDTASVRVTAAMSRWLPDPSSTLKPPADNGPPSTADRCAYGLDLAIANQRSTVTVFPFRFGPGDLP
jgi:hypothetical protein